MEHTVSQQPKSVEPTAAVEKQQQQQFPEKITKQTLKKPPAVPMRTNSSLSNSNKTTTITNNNQKDQKVYETDIIWHDDHDDAKMQKIFPVWHSCELWKKPFFFFCPKTDNSLKLYCDWILKVWKSVKKLQFKELCIV